MYINGLNGYLSEYEGTEVDAAVSRVQGLDAEFALKVDKTTKINGFPLTGNINLTAENIGALASSTTYASSLVWDTQDDACILYLKDQNGRVLSSEHIEIDLGRWGHIVGTLSDQTDLKNALDAKQDKITSSNKLSSDLVDDTGKTHKFATAGQLTQIETNKNNIATNTSDIATNAGKIATNTTNIATNASNIATNTSSISTINGKIPSQASSSNQLADKNFVNSSIATNTSYFIGTFNSVAELEAYSGTLTNNDYAFVVSVDTAGNTIYNRYKYTTGTTPASWKFEYALNNSSFTAVQWAAINSGATTTNIGQITTNKNNISTINSTLSGYGNIVTHNTSEFATAAQGAKADSALQSINSSMVTSALGYTPYNSTNPDGYISGITSSMVTSALGYTPYNSTNPNHYISSAAVSTLTDVNLASVSNGQFLRYDSSSQKWKNVSISFSGTLEGLSDVAIMNPYEGQVLYYDETTQKWKNESIAIGSAIWGNISGTLSNQTDLQNALDSKASVTFRDWPE